jgi:polyferredoxin
LSWIKDKTKRISLLRVITQLTFWFIVLYVSIIGVWKGLLLFLIIGATLFFGRVFCGWICPLGFYMDTLTLLRRLLRVHHWSLPKKANSDLNKTRYLMTAAIFMLVIPSFLFGTATLTDISNLVTLRPPFTAYAFLLEPLQPIILPWRPPFGALLEAGGVNLTFPYVGEILLYLRNTGLALPLAYIFVTVVLLVSFKVRRFWCRFCPTGISLATVGRYRWFRWLPLLRLSKKGVKCTKCGICSRVCPVQIEKVYEKNDGGIDTSMCTLCLRCVEMCPEKDCLSLKLAGRTLCKSRNWLEPVP